MSEPFAARIASLNLHCFRNFVAGELKFGAAQNLLIGPNGAGKTNLLEAVHLLSTTRSFRGAKDAEMVMSGHSAAKLQCEAGLDRLELRIPSHGRRTAAINGSEVGRVSELMGRMPSVCFSTADMDVVRGEPSDQRRFLDVELSQQRPQYLRWFTVFNSALRQRNALLKAIRGGTEPRSSLPVWNRELAESSSCIRAARIEYLNELSELADRFHQELSLGAESLEIEYLYADESSDADSFVMHLDRCESQDIAAGFTTIGAHRDRVAIRISGREAKSFASQGQQRTAVLAIKLAQVEQWKAAKRVVPILLLDDIFSDLDQERRKRVLAVSGGLGQVVITATDLGSVESALSGGAKVFRVQNGKVEATCGED